MSFPFYFYTTVRTDERPQRPRASKGNIAEAKDHARTMYLSLGWASFWAIIPRQRTLTKPPSQFPRSISQAQPFYNVDLNPLMVTGCCAGGSAFCEHSREKNKCKDCGGSGICEHGRENRTSASCAAKSIACCSSGGSRTHGGRHGLGLLYDVYEGKVEAQHGHGA